MTQQFKFGDHDSIARQSTTQLADLLRLAIELNSPEYHDKPLNGGFFDGDLRCSPTCSNQIRL